MTAVTNIIRSNPFRLMDREFGTLHGALDRLWGDSLLRDGLLDDGNVDVDVYERDGTVVVEASLPGFDKDEIDVQLHEGVLAIKAERTEEKEEQDRSYFRRERRYGALSRRIALPGIVTDAPVDATFKDGVLTIEIAQPEKPRPKAIEIKG